MFRICITEVSVFSNIILRALINLCLGARFPEIPLCLMIGYEMGINLSDIPEKPHQKYVIILFGEIRLVFVVILTHPS
jgi:hypothetical protein